MQIKIEVGKQKMDARRLTDERILDILESDSQKGIVLLMEKYTALLWHVS